MQSIKNTVVSIILLFLSYGVYQVITKPLPSEVSSGDFQPLSIADPVEPTIPPDLLAEPDGIGLAASAPASKAIPPQLLDFDEPAEPAFSDSNDTSEPLNSLESFEPQSSFAESNLSFQDDPLSPPASQFQSDSEIIPSTVMTTVASRSSATIDDDTDNSLPTSAPATPTLTESWSKINQMVEHAQFKDALVSLSNFYRNENYEAVERPQLLEYLDALAAKVIYSSEHHLRSLPYIIQPGDTIGSLARNWQIPAQLIYNVNVDKIPDPNDLEAGVEIKLIQGPFDAEIDSNEQQLTLYLGDMYAGRFSIQPGNRVDQGEYQIVDKSAKDNLERPYWMALNNGGSIFAATQPPNGANEIAMNPQEAEEIFSILSATSKVTIIR